MTSVGGAEGMVGPRSLDAPYPARLERRSEGEKRVYRRDAEGAEGELRQICWGGCWHVCLKRYAGNRTADGRGRTLMGNEEKKDLPQSFHVGWTLRRMRNLDTECTENTEKAPCLFI